MSLQMIQVLELIFAIGGVAGFCVDSAPHWIKWLCCFLFLFMDTWRCLRVGEISTGPNYKWYGFTFSRDDSPEIFAGLVLVQTLLTLVLFFIFLGSLSL